MLFLKLLSRLPLSVLYVFGGLLYLLVYYVVGYRKKVVYENLHNAFPDKSSKELKRIQKQFYKNLSQVIVEILKTYSISGEEIQKRVTVRNPEILDEFLKQNSTSKIAVVGHMCNWEWLLHGCLFNLNIPIDAVYKELSNKKFDLFMYELRSKFGGKPVEMKRFPREVIRNMDSLKFYALIADQSPKKNEIKLWIPFLNQETGFYLGPALIAQKNNLPVFFVGMKRLKRGYYEVFFEIIAEPPFTDEDVPDIMTSYAGLLEKYIKASPADWLWSHKRWKHKKPS